MEDQTTHYSIGTICAGLAGTFVGQDVISVETAVNKEEKKVETVKVLELSDFPDILKFNNEDNPVHLIYCRFIPSIATYISYTSGFDIKESGKLEEYTQSVKDILYQYGISKESAWLFIEKAINTTEELLLDDYDTERVEIENRLLDYLRSSDTAFDNIKILKIVLSLLNDNINKATMSIIRLFFMPLGISEERIVDLFISTGLSQGDIYFPTLPITIKNYPDILSFTKDPIGEAYNTKKHLGYCRIAPALASYFARLEFELVNDEKEYIRELKDELGINYYNFYVQEFVSQTIQKVVYMTREELKELKFSLKEALSEFSLDGKEKIVKASLKLFNELSEASYKELIDILSLDNKVKIDEFFTSVNLNGSSYQAFYEKEENVKFSVFERNTDDEVFEELIHDDLVEDKIEIKTQEDYGKFKGEILALEPSYLEWVEKQSNKNE